MAWRQLCLPPQTKSLTNTSKKSPEKKKLNFSRSVLFTLEPEFVSNISPMIVSGNSFLLLTRPKFLQT